jgi:hypothetical protein
MSTVATDRRVRVLHILGIDDSRRLAINRLGSGSLPHQYSFVGNVELLPLLDPARFRVINLTRGGMPSTPVHVPPVDVVLNAICDPDTNAEALRVTAAVVAQIGRPVVNHPTRVLELTRELVPEVLAGEPGIVAPRTTRMRPRYLTDISTAMEDGELVAPFLFRQAGTHGGTALELIEGPDDLAKLERFAFDGRSFYVTPYVDFRSADGLFRKFRVLFIDGQPFAKHLIVSDHWMVHAQSRERVMDSRPDLQEEEAAFIRTFRADTFPVLANLGPLIGLDYFGIDFGFDADGNVVLFEVNACVRALTGTSTTSDVASHQESTAAIQRAFGDLLVRRAQSA